MLAQPAVRLRDAIASDTKSIADIYNESIMAGDATMDSEAKTEADIQGWMDKFSDRETILVLEELHDPPAASPVVGWGIIKRYSDRYGYRFCCETAVYLRRSHIGRGYGTRIKNALIERCKVYGYHHLVAKIFAENEASIQYNLRLGYEMVGIQRQIGWRDGRWLDVAILQLILDDVQVEKNSHQTP